MTTKAQELKEEADKLFRQQRYFDSYLKYREASELDDKNPILFSNRALCALKLKHYLDAECDSRVAIAFDPSYVKAYIRHGEANNALHRHWVSKAVWKEALDALPTEKNLTPAELDLKKAIERGSADTERQDAAVKAQVEGRAENTKEFPVWRRVMAICKGKTTEEIGRLYPPNTSVCQILTAYHTYVEVAENVQHKLQSPDCRCEKYDSRCALTELTRVVMGEMRVLWDFDRAWPTKVETLLHFTNQAFDGWKDLKPDVRFQKSVKGHAAREGWDGARSALSATIKCWIVHAIMLETSNPVSQAEYLSRAIKVLKWARSYSQLRGVLDHCACCAEVYQTPFLLATQKLHLTAQIKTAADETDGTKKNRVLEEILTEAEEVIKEGTIIATQPREDNEVYLVAFCDIPLGAAFAAKGYYYWETARKHPSRKDFEKYLKMSSEFYLKAVTFFPVDDEMRARYLNRAIECMMLYGAPLGVQLKKADELREAVEKMKPVWGDGVVACGKALQDVVAIMQNIKGLVDQGKLKASESYRCPNPGVNVVC
ncbi:TPR-likeprotein [Moniliophthora roreri MCA 2997]|uniref:TPR-likeprotein n=1 Tax=Moniliophthora roreri (strain MCA 2997) TaxID=1381753 RepID=V2WX97_MONRO|nr:TPR-likeprotein [Moniliophthora roreri MCA 2997]